MSYHWNLDIRNWRAFFAFLLFLVLVGGGYGIYSAIKNHKPVEADVTISASIEVSFPEIYANGEPQNGTDMGWGDITKRTMNYTIKAKTFTMSLPIAPTGKTYVVTETKKHKTEKNVKIPYPTGVYYVFTFKASDGLSIDIQLI